MRAVVFSDSHGNYDVLEKIMERHKNDGDIFEILKLHKNFNDTWRARRMMKPASPEEVEEYKKGLERSNIRRKIYRGKSRGRKSMPKGE